MSAPTVTQFTSRAASTQHRSPPMIERPMIAGLLLAAEMRR